MVRFHPVISIILGFIVYEVIYLTSIQGFGLYSGIGTVQFYVALMLGGFIATYFSKEKKVQYGIYEGILIMIAIVAATLGFGETLNIQLSIIFFTVFASTFFGGAIAKRITRNSQKQQEKIV